MTRSPHESQKFARGSLPASAIGGPANSPRHGRAATFIIDDQPQMGTDTALGRRWGVCRLALAVGRTGRLTTGGLGCSSLNWPGLRSRRSLNRNGFGRRANVPFAINTYAADNSRKNIAQPLKRHFVSPFFVANQPSDGVNGSAQEAIGVYQNDDCC